MMAPAAMEEHGKGHVIITAIGEPGIVKGKEVIIILMVLITVIIILMLSIPLLNAPVRLDRPNAPASLINPAQTANGQMQEPIATGMV